MRIDFDPAKRNWTLEHRFVDFLDAAEILLGRQFTVEDLRKNYGEPRFITYRMLRGRLMVVGWTPRIQSGLTVWHVFSMRKANAREEARFQDRLREAGRVSGDT